MLRNDLYWVLVFASFLVALTTEYAVFHVELPWISGFCAFTAGVVFVAFALAVFACVRKQGN